MAHTKAERDQLEALLDRMGVADFFVALTQIAGEKSDHAIEAWQDRYLAQRWERLSTKFDKLAAAIDDPYFQ